MVLETLLESRIIRNKPWLVALDIILVSTVAIWLSFYILPENTSILAIAFITIASMPMIHNLFLEVEDRNFIHKKGFFSRYNKLIVIYSFFFIGLVASFSFWYLVLPETQTSIGLGFSEINVPTKSAVFGLQEQDLTRIDELSSSLSGKASLTPVMCNDFWTYFDAILVNNLSVLFLAVLFSFIYGAGALFLIAWNASVLAVKIGKIAVVFSQELFAGFGFGQVFLSYIWGLFYLVNYVPHGIFEIPGFFVGAIAGGLISVGMTKKYFGTKKFFLIAKDAAILLIVAVVFIVIGAIIESYLISISC